MLFNVFLHITFSLPKISPRTMIYNIYKVYEHKKIPLTTDCREGNQDGDYLLSHLRSTIGVTKLNFSVRNGKRWNLRAIVT